MVFKKYSVKNGKKYGPYLYHNERVGEKVVTSYVGRGKEEKSRRLSSPLIAFVLVLAFLVLALVFFVLYKSSPTGFVSLEVQPQYNLGENLNGIVNFNFKKGELIPSDSKILISLGSQSKEVSLASLIDDHIISGDYYAEQHPLNGAGEGYGVIGEKISYPTIDFELLIKNQEESSETSSSTDSSETSAPETPTTEEIQTTETSEQTTETLTQENTETSTISTSPETTESSEASSFESSSSTDSSSSESSSDSDSSSSSDTSSSESSSSSDSGSSDSSGGDSGGITGNVIEENEFTVSGSVSNGENFEYNLDDGRSAEFVPGSAKINGESVDDSLISIRESSGKLIASTDYTIKEEGFGRDYLGNFGLSLPIDLGKLGITAEQGILNIEIIAQDSAIAHSEQIIGIRPESIPTNTSLEFVKDIPQQRIKSGDSIELNLREYFTGAEQYAFEANNITAKIDDSSGLITLVADEGFKGAKKAKIIAIKGSEQVESNEFNILVSSGAINIDTTHTPIKVGEEVKWTQKINLETPEAITIDLPKDAENVNISKLDVNLEQVPVSETNVESSDSGFSLTGNVVIDIELHNQPRIITILKNFFSGMTGNVIEGQEEVNAETSITPTETQEVTITDASTQYTVEYTTPAPTAEEISTREGKQVTVSAEDSLGYKDVLAYANIPEVYSVGQENSIKIYWANNDSYLPFDAYDLDGNGKIDYIEWIVPHLSNQTFEIILITKAMQLDSNKNVVQDIYNLVGKKDGVSAYISEQNYIQVMFEQNLTLGKDMTVYAKGIGMIYVYNVNSNDPIGEISVNSPDIKEYKIYPSYTFGDSYDLKITGNIEVDYIVDPIDCSSYGFSDCQANSLCTVNTDPNICSSYGSYESCSGASDFGCSPSMNGDCSIYGGTGMDSDCYNNPGCSADYTQSCEGLGENDCGVGSYSSCTPVPFDCGTFSNIDDCNMQSGNGCVSNTDSCSNLAYPDCTSVTGCSDYSDHCEGTYLTSCSGGNFASCSGTYAGSYNNNCLNNPGYFISCSGDYFTGCSGTIYLNGDSGCSSSPNNCEDGTSCISYSDSTICTNGAEGSACNSNGVCTSGYCSAPIGICTNGSVNSGCIDSSSCVGGLCASNNKCGGLVGDSCETVSCQTGYYCGIYTCTTGETGSECNDNGDCISQSCSDGYCISPDPALIAKYSFENNADDSSGNNNNGIWGGVQSSIAYTTGVSGQAASFNSETYVNASITGIPTGSQPRTYAFWINYAQDENTIMFSQGTTSSNDAFYMFRYGPNNGDISGKMVVGIWGSGSYNGVSLSTVSTNEWHHVVVSYNGTYVDFYLDDVLQSSQAATYSTSSGNLFIGKFDPEQYNSYLFVGAMDEFQVYNYALSSSDVTTLYNSYSSTPALIAEYDFENNANDALGVNNGTWAGEGNLNQYAAGVSGQAAYFDGASYITTPLTISSIPLTVSGWFYITSTEPGNQWLLGADDGNGNTVGVDLWYNQFQNFYGTGYENTGVYITPNTWTYLTYTINSSESKLYVDGQLAYTGSAGESPSSTAVTIGANGNAASKVNGYIDEYKVYNYVLTAEEINTSFNSLAVLGCMNSSAINYNPSANIDDSSCTGRIGDSCDPSSDPSTQCVSGYCSGSSFVCSSGEIGVSCDDIYNQAWQCSSSRCVDGYCAAALAGHGESCALIECSQSPDGQICNTYDYTCTWGQIGEPCNTGDECPYASNICGSNNLCGANNGDLCSGGEPCQSSYCLDDSLAGYTGSGAICSDKSIGSPCSTTNQATECSSGYCSGEPGVCSLKSNGVPCSADGECSSGVCGTNNLCGITLGTTCDDNSKCQSGYCGYGDGRVCTTGENGQGCTSGGNDQCISGICNELYYDNFFCVGSDGQDCTINEYSGLGYCNSTYCGSDSKCTDKQIGSHCGNATDCDSQICISNICASDTIYPQVSFATGTPDDASSQSRTSIYADVNVVEDNFANLTIYLYNTSLVSSQTFTNSVRAYNFTSLADGTYYLNATACDLANQCNSTETRTITIDSVAPTITFIQTTPNNNSYMDASPSGVLTVNVSATGTLSTITFDLINSSGSHNFTTYSGAQALSVRGYSWVIPAGADGTYTYKVNVTKTNGLSATSAVRTINALPSCLEQCSEGAESDCNITLDCYLFSTLCTNSVCDFRNLEVGAKIRTLYDPTTGDALNLAINLSGNLSFVYGAGEIIFSGREGSDLGTGSAGGDASIVNITVANLLNTRYAVFKGLGGKSTAAATNGGNGGSLVLNYRGLIGNFSDAADLGSYWDDNLQDSVNYADNAPAMTGGANALDAVTGSTGTIVYNKNIDCTVQLRDADITGDGLIGAADWGIIQEDYNDRSGVDSNYSAAYDINCDNILNIKEIAKIGFQVGTR